MISIFMKLTEIVGDQTAMLCLSLAALMLENPEIDKKDSMISTLVGINVNQLDG